MYYVDEPLHQRLLKSNPTFTLKIANNKDTAPTVDIVLPYASFDLTMQPPLAVARTSYFPIRRAANETQYTLGRAFLQEA